MTEVTATYTGGAGERAGHRRRRHKKKADDDRSDDEYDDRSDDGTGSALRKMRSKKESQSGQNGKDPYERSRSRESYDGEHKDERDRYYKPSPEKKAQELREFNYTKILDMERAVIDKTYPRNDILGNPSASTPEQRYRNTRGIQGNYSQNKYPQSEYEQGLEYVRAPQQLQFLPNPHVVPVRGYGGQFQPQPAYGQPGLQTSRYSFLNGGMNPGHGGTQMERNPQSNAHDNYGGPAYPNDRRSVPGQQQPGYGSRPQYLNSRPPYFQY